MLFNFALNNNSALIYTQWFIDVLFITHDSRTSNKLCGRKTTKQNILALQKYSLLLSFCHPVELNSGSQDCKTSPCEVLLPETYAERFTFLPSSRSSVSFLSVRPRILNIKYVLIVVIILTIRL